jgi:serine/threonine protein kinase
MSRTILMQIELDLYASLLLRLSYAYLSCQLSDVAKGLCYLHSCNIIHGDLKGVRGYSRSCFAAVLTPREPNILVNNSGHALITDFGFATVARNLDSILSAPPQRGHTKRWAAPEILDEGPNSKEADIFAFAMVMIEVRHGWSTV